VNSLADIINDFEQREALQNPDEILPAHALSMTGQGTIKTPNGANLALTDWSRSQLSTLLGVRWDKWFSRASGEERADEVNRRLARMGEAPLKLRSSRTTPDTIDADGILDGILSPAYTPISDSQIARLVAGALTLHEPELKVIRNFSTDRTTSYVVTVGKPLRRGSAVGDMMAGVLIQNSGCGFCALSIQAHVVRLVCKNGMKAIDRANIVHKRHRGLDMNIIAEGIFEGVRRLPGTISRTLDLIDYSTRIDVGDVDREVRQLLQQARLPLRHAAPIMAAYRDEPIRTAFGITQAVTAHARDVSSEERVELEAAASAYLASVVS
jgi:hypothetical protein